MFMFMSTTYMQEPDSRKERGQRFSFETSHTRYGKFGR
jgi:hypothetical protein